MPRKLFRSVFELAVLLALSPVLAQPTPTWAQEQTITLDAQGHDPRWEQNPHMREFYELSAAMLRGSVQAADIAAYEERAYAIFRSFATSLGADPAAMFDHLKDIPRQIVAIVRDDPSVLDSYDAFLVALRGPP